VSFADLLIVCIIRLSLCPSLSDHYRLTDHYSLTQFRDSYKDLHYSEFEPNKFLLFLKSDESWHGVKKISGLGGFTRKAFIINVFCR